MPILLVFFCFILQLCFFTTPSFSGSNVTNHNFTDAIQDGEGHIWALSRGKNRTLYLWKKDQFEEKRFDFLNEEGIGPIRFGKGRKGEVYCLWRGSNGKKLAIKRHLAMTLNL